MNQSLSLSTMSILAHGTYHRATQALLDGDFFHNSRRGNSNDLACRDLVYLDTYCEAEEAHIDDTGLWFVPIDADAHRIRYMNAFARKIQRCWFNREEQPMACPCPESPPCWTCGEKVGNHKEYRDALGEFEYTCDGCHKNEYPEQYEE